MSSLDHDAPVLAASAPSISVILPVRDPDLRDLERAVASVDRQVWPHRELCVADDGSKRPEICHFLAELSTRPAVRSVRREEAGGIAVATNAALALARGDFVLFLDHDDEFADDAIIELVRVVQRHPEIDFVYSDHDVVDADGRRIGIDLKPDWSPELLLSYMYVGHAKLMRTQLVRSLDGMRPGFEGSADHDLALRLAERTDRVHHVPKLLYHWRAARGSMASHSATKTYAFQSGRRAVQEAVDRRNLHARVEWADWARRARLGVHHLRFEALQEVPVTVVLAVDHGGDVFRHCVKSIERRTLHRAYNILAVDWGGRVEGEPGWDSASKHRLLRASGVTSRAAALRDAVAAADTDYLLLLHDDTLVVEPEWLDELLGFAQIEGVGAVGAKLVRSDGSIDHAGILLGVQGAVASAFAGRLDTVAPLEYGYYAHTARDCAAVSAACLLTRRSLYLQVGGFENKELPPSLQDVDYCLRLLRSGLRVVVNPYAELLHLQCRRIEESVTAEDVAALRRCCGERLIQDPYFHPSFSRLDANFTLRTLLDEGAALRFPPGDAGDARSLAGLDLETICRAQEARLHVLSGQLARAEATDRLLRWARGSPGLRALRRSPLVARGVTRVRRSRAKPWLARWLRRLRILG